LVFKNRIAEFRRRHPKYTAKIRQKKIKGLIENLTEKYKKYTTTEDILKFLKGIEKKFSIIRILYPQSKHSIEDMYIPLKLTTEPIHKPGIKDSFEYTAIEKSPEKVYAFKDIEPETLQSITWEEAKKKSRRIMVLADPGMGKTTLLKMEATSTARTEWKKLDENEIIIDEIIIPIFLNLFDLSRSTEPIMEAIPKRVKINYKNVTPQIMALLRQKLETGKCILLLDALDEVPIKYRNKLLDRLNNFIEDCPCQVICTSRVVGYPRFLLGKTKEVEIVPFNQFQIENYVENWFGEVPENNKEFSNSPEALLQDLQNKLQIRGLAQNPLMLSLICNLYQERNSELPTRRCEIFRESLEYMIGKLGRKRRFQSDGRIEAKISLLEELSYHFSCKGQDLFSLRELLIYTREYLEDGKSLTHFHDPASIVTEFSEDDGILIKPEKGGKIYKFFHRTFQEYLTASYLKELYNKDQNIGIREVRDYYWDFDWHETIVLLASLINNPIPLIRDITERQDDIFNSLLILAGRCIAECKEIVNVLVIEIFEKIHKMWIVYPREKYIKSALIALSRSNSLLPKTLLKQYKDEKQNIKEIIDILIGEIANLSNSPTLVENLKALAKKLNDLIPTTFEDLPNADSIPVLIEALSDKSMEVRCEAAISLEKIGNTKAAPALIEALSDNSSTVKRYAARALRRIACSDDIPALIEALKDEDREVKMYAAEALCVVGSNEGYKIFMEILKGKHKDSIMLKYQAIRVLKKNANLDILKELIESPEIDIYDPKIFSLARDLVRRFYNEDVSYIPVYPEIVGKFRK
jgi:predicted NACHT family NTPase